MLYDTFVRRTVSEQLRSEQRAQIRAVLSNGGYLQSQEGLDARKAEIDQINDHYDEVIDNIMDPGKSEREQRALENNPLFAAGIRGLDRLRWDFMGGQMAADQLRAQGL